MMNVFIVLALAVCVSAAPAPATVSDMLTTGGFTTLLDDFVKAKMMNVLQPTGPITIFAPTNEAFTLMASGDMYKQLNSDMNMLKKLLQCHVLAKKLSVADIKNDMTVTAMSGDALRFNIYGKTMTVNGVSMTLLPQLTSDNVVIYMVNHTLVSDMGHDMVEVLQMHAPSFSTLVHAIQVAGLLETFQEGGPFTLFAPTDNAFKSLPDGYLEKTMASPDSIKKLLLGHVAKGTYFLQGVTSMDLATVDGGSVKIVANANGTTINKARIVNDASDMIAENGVIHVIDRVLSA